MRQKYRFLYHLLNLIPCKTERLHKLLDLLRFYYKQNNLQIVCADGSIINNPIKIPNFLYLKTYGDASDNTVIIPYNCEQGSNIRLEFHGACTNTLKFGTGNMIVMTAYIQGANGKMNIGNNNYIVGSILYFYCSGTTTFTLGNGNLFSDNIIFWAGEGHCMINPTTRDITNAGGNICIGNDNWICMNTCFLKRANIGNGCVIGYGSVVGKDFSNEDSCVIAGNPAIIAKKDILWAETAPWNYKGEVYRNK